MNFGTVRLGMVVPVLAAGGAFLFAAPATEAWTAPAKAADLRNPFAAASAAALSEGKRLYQDRCADCHGSKGRGDGSAAADFSRRPPNFARVGTWQQTDGELFWKITEGRRPMPSYRSKLSEEQRWQVVSYLRTLIVNPSETKGRNKP